MSTEHDEDQNYSNDYGVGAGRDYDRDVRRYVREGRVADAAEAARRSIEGPDGPSLYEAEVDTAREGAMPGDPLWASRVRVAAHRGVDVLLSAIVRAEAWLEAHVH